MSCARPATIALLTLAMLIAAVAGGDRVTAATTFTVGSSTDAVDSLPGDGLCDDGAGNCTLRAAIQETNALAGPDTIILPPGTYAMSIAGIGEDDSATGDLDVTDDLTITGAGRASTIIDGGALDRVFDVGPSASGMTVHISGVTIENGSLEGGGAGIHNRGALALTDSTISGNTTTMSHGGGIMNYDVGVLTMDNVTVTGNSADRVGAGICNSNAGTATLTNVTVSGNTGDFFGGGIGNWDSTLTLSNITVSGNTARLGGGIWNSGAATLTDSTVSGNTGNWFGGGIKSDDGTLTIANSTVSSNTAGDSGGGISTSNGTVRLTNVTVSDNTTGYDPPSSQRRGGGIFASSTTLDLSNVSVTGNAAGSGGGIFIYAGTATLSNTIVANSISGGDCSAAITSNSNNLDSDGTCGLSAAGDLSNTNPLLGPLADNGGPTHTHALLSGSPAIDAGSDDCPPPDTDQRGVARPIDGNSDGAAVCDIGAYEFEPAPVGGIVEFQVPPSDPPQGQTHGSGASTLPYAVLTGTALAIAAGGWYARKRWLG